jgi:hypothetical protein
LWISERSGKNILSYISFSKLTPFASAILRKTINAIF